MGKPPAGSAGSSPPVGPALATNNAFLGSGLAPTANTGTLSPAQATREAISGSSQNPVQAQAQPLVTAVSSKPGSFSSLQGGPQDKNSRPISPSPEGAKPNA